MFFLNENFKKLQTVNFFSVKLYKVSNATPKVKKAFRWLASAKYICMPNSGHDRDRVDGERKREKLEKKYQRYLWLLVTVAIFYCIPVFQLIINYLTVNR